MGSRQPGLILALCKESRSLPAFGAGVSGLARYAVFRDNKIGAETMKKLSPVTKKTEYVPSLRGKIVRRSMKLSARETASVRAATVSLARLISTHCR